MSAPNSNPDKPVIPPQAHLANAPPSAPSSAPANAPIPHTPLDDDDEFEDFPVDDWADEETDLAGGAGEQGGAHLWEESWDDDDTNDDFSVQLKEELKKVEESKKSG